MCGWCHLINNRVYKTDLLWLLMSVLSSATAVKIGDLANFSMSSSTTSLNVPANWSPLKYDWYCIAVSLVKQYLQGPNHEVILTNSWILTMEYSLHTTMCTFEEYQYSLVLLVGGLWLHCLHITLQSGYLHCCLMIGQRGMSDQSHMLEVKALFALVQGIIFCWSLCKHRST